MEVKQVYPIFEEGRLLKKDALDLIRDYAPDYFSLLFMECGDGVIGGFKIDEKDGRVTVGPGILKLGSGFLCMAREAQLPLEHYGQTVQIVIRRLGVIESHDFRTERYELSLEPVRALSKGECELGRFRLERGAKLRSYGDYKDFQDLTTEFNTLNLVHVPYACEGGSCLLPLILKLYGRGVMSSPKAEPLDLAFAAACLGGACVSVDLLSSYLNARERTGNTEAGNVEWYRRLGRLYTRLAGGGDIRQRPLGRSGKTIID